MVIDLAYLIYSVLIVYAVIGTLVLGLVIIGAWRLTAYLKELHEQREESAQGQRALSHPPLAHNGAQAR